MSGAVRLIEEKERHIAQANKVLMDLKKNEHSRFGEYVICDDGQDVWLADVDTWEEALEFVVKKALDGRFDTLGLTDQELSCEAYNLFCNECPAYYSRIGSGSHNHRQGELIEMMSETLEDHEVKEIIEILGLSLESENEVVS